MLSIQLSILVMHDFDLITCVFMKLFAGANLLCCHASLILDSKLRIQISFCTMSFRSSIIRSLDIAITRFNSSTSCFFSVVGMLSKLSTVVSNLCMISLMVAIPPSYLSVRCCSVGSSSCPPRSSSPSFLPMPYANFFSIYGNLALNGVCSAFGLSEWG